MFNIILFLYANNFLLYANYLNLLLVIYCIWKSKFLIRLSFSGTFSFLIFSSISYMFIYIRNYGFTGFSSFFMRFISPILLFYIGVYRSKKGTNQLINDMLIIGFAEFVHGFLNVITNLNVKVLEVEGRPYNDIYGGIISATIQNLLFIVSCSLLFYFLVCEKRKRIKIIGLLSILGGLYGTIANASRTLIYLTVISFVIALFMYSLLYHKKQSKVFKVWLCVFVIFIIGGIVISLDLFQLAERFVNTSLGQRLLQNNSDIPFGNNIRLLYARNILVRLFKYPMGNMPYPHYAHNLWVDVAKETGIIPLIMYSLFSILSLKTVIYIFMSKKIEKDLKIFIVSLTVAYYIAFFTEPIMIGAPYIFANYCFLIGFLTSVKSKINRN